MATMQPAKAKKVVASNSLHFSNEMDAPAEETSGVEVENNMSVDTLIDPEDYEPSGATHFGNEEDSHPTMASTKKPKRAKVRASGMDDGGSPLDPDTTNVGTIPNDVDPADGVLVGADFDASNVDPDDDDDVDLDAEDDPDGEVDDMDFGNDVDASMDDEGGDTHIDNENDPAMVPADAVMQNNDSVTPLEVNSNSEDEDGDWDAPAAESEEDLADDDLAELEGEENPGVEIEDLDAGPEPEAATTGEDLSILDVDETPDEATDGVAFAAAGTRLLCIKANRIIASMTGRMAVASGRNELYLTDQFQQVTAMEIKAKGLRRGLKSMGFALATVNLSKQSVLKAQVAKEVTKTTAAVRKVAAENNKSFEQALAIAAVGINRKMFKDQDNALRAHLEGEFRRMGIQGAGRILAHAFAEHGPAYTKQVVELARKVQAMPEEVRDGYADMMDLQSDVMDEPDEDMVPIGAEGDDSDIDDGDSFESSDFGETIEATLARPGTRIKAHSAASGKFSVEANQILAGSRPLFG